MWNKEHDKIYTSCFSQNKNRSQFFFLVSLFSFQVPHSSGTCSFVVLTVRSNINDEYTIQTHITVALALHMHHTKLKMLSCIHSFSHQMLK